MGVTLLQYAESLDQRKLPWPSPPSPVPVKAKPSTAPVPGIRLVLWNTYGTLLNIAGGDLRHQVDDDFMMNIALDKTITEFKMWGSMSRKPGQPAEYMKEIYKKVFTEFQFAGSDVKLPEIASHRVWEAIIGKLFQKEYKYDTTFYGDPNEFSQKVAFFFHRSLQGTAAYPHAATAIKEIAQLGIKQGVLSNGQVFTLPHLQYCLSQQSPGYDFQAVLQEPHSVISFKAAARKPEDKVFEQSIEMIEQMGISPGQVLHIGNSIPRDLKPAKQWGMKTALFAGDRTSLEATSEDLKHPASRPDALLTQLIDIIPLLGH